MWLEDYIEQTLDKLISDYTVLLTVVSDNSSREQLKKVMVISLQGLHLIVYFFSFIHKKKIG